MMHNAKLILAALAATCAAPSVASSDTAPLENWSTATVIPERVANVLRVDGNRLFWNGEEASEDHVRAFLKMVKNKMSPQPLTILSYSGQTPSARIQQARVLVDEVIQCEPDNCLEVTAAVK